jgi:hypothetical protein
MSKENKSYSTLLIAVTMLCAMAVVGTSIYNLCVMFHLVAQQ